MVTPRVDAEFPDDFQHIGRTLTDGDRLIVVATADNQAYWARLSDFGIPSPDGVISGISFALNSTTNVLTATVARTAGLSDLSGSIDLSGLGGGSATIPTGTVVFKGDFSTTTAYKQGEMVQDSNAYYMAVVDVAASNTRPASDKRRVSGGSLTGNWLVVEDFATAVTLSSATPQPTGTASAGSATDASRSDHVHASNITVPQPETELPLVAGTASAGTDSDYARGDHVHPAQALRTLSNATPVASTTGAGASGSSSEVSRSDHRHQTPAGSAPTPLSNATPLALGTAASGSGTSASRDDHVHPSQTIPDPATPSLFPEAELGNYMRFTESRIGSSTWRVSSSTPASGRFQVVSATQLKVDWRDEAPASHNFAAEFPAGSSNILEFRNSSGRAFAFAVTTTPPTLDANNDYTLTGSVSRGSTSGLAGSYELWVLTPVGTPSANGQMGVSGGTTMVLRNNNLAGADQSAQLNEAVGARYRFKDLDYTNQADVVVAVNTEADVGGNHTLGVTYVGSSSEAGLPYRASVHAADFVDETHIADDTITPGMLKADSDAEKLAMRTRLGAGTSNGLVIQDSGTQEGTDITTVNFGDNLDVSVNGGVATVSGQSGGGGGMADGVVNNANLTLTNNRLNLRLNRSNSLSDLNTFVDGVVTAADVGGVNNFYWSVTVLEDTALTDYRGTMKILDGSVTPGANGFGAGRALNALTAGVKTFVVATQANQGNGEDYFSVTDADIATFVEAHQVDSPNREGEYTLTNVSSVTTIGTGNSQRKYFTATLAITTAAVDAGGTLRFHSINSAGVFTVPARDVHGGDERWIRRTEAALRGVVGGTYSADANVVGATGSTGVVWVDALAALARKTNQAEFNFGEIVPTGFLGSTVFAISTDVTNVPGSAGFSASTIITSWAGVAAQDGNNVTWMISKTDGYDDTRQISSTEAQSLDHFWNYQTIGATRTGNYIVSGTKSNFTSATDFYWWRAPLTVVGTLSGSGARLLATGDVPTHRNLFIPWGDVAGLIERFTPRTENWQANKRYRVGDPVVQAGTLYLCKTANNDATFTSSKWFDTTTQSGGGSSDGVVNGLTLTLGANGLVVTASRSNSLANVSSAALALFDNTNPADLGSASAGTQNVAARRDHVHNTPSTTIADDSIEEVKLKVSNSPTDGYILEFTNSTTGMTWVAKPSGGGGTPDDGSVTTAKLADDAVTQAKLADNSVGESQMRNDAIGEPELKVSNSPTGGYILEWTSTATGLRWVAKPTVGTIADGAVTTAKIADDAVTEAKVADDAVGEPQLKVSNNPTNGYILEYKDSTDGLTWVVKPSGGGSGTPATGSLTLAQDNNTTDTLTLASGLATPTGKRNIVIQAETGTEDDFIGFSGTSIPDGAQVLIRADSGDTIVAKHNATGGNLQLANSRDFILNEVSDALIIQRDGTNYREVAGTPLRANVGEFGVVSLASNAQVAQGTAPAFSVIAANTPPSDLRERLDVVQPALGEVDAGDWWTGSTTTHGEWTKNASNADGQGTMAITSAGALEINKYSGVPPNYVDQSTALGALAANSQLLIRNNNGGAGGALIRVTAAGTTSGTGVNTKYTWTSAQWSVLEGELGSNGDLPPYPRLSTVVPVTGNPSAGQARSTSTQIVIADTPQESGLGDQSANFVVGKLILVENALFGGGTQGFGITAVTRGTSWATLTVTPHHSSSIRLPLKGRYRFVDTTDDAIVLVEEHTLSQFDAIPTSPVTSKAYKDYVGSTPTPISELSKQRSTPFFYWGGGTNPNAANAVDDEAIIKLYGSQVAGTTTVTDATGNWLRATTASTPDWTNLDYELRTVNSKPQNIMPLCVRTGSQNYVSVLMGEADADPNRCTFQVDLAWPNRRNGIGYLVIGGHLPTHDITNSDDTISDERHIERGGKIFLVVGQSNIGGDGDNRIRLTPKRVNSSAGVSGTGWVTAQGLGSGALNGSSGGILGVNGGSTGFWATTTGNNLNDLTRFTFRIDAPHIHAYVSGRYVGSITYTLPQGGSTDNGLPTTNHWFFAKRVTSTVNWTSSALAAWSSSTASYAVNATVAYPTPTTTTQFKDVRVWIADKAITTSGVTPGTADSAGDFPWREVKVGDIMYAMRPGKDGFYGIVGRIWGSTNTTAAGLGRLVVANLDWPI